MNYRFKAEEKLEGLYEAVQAAKEELEQEQQALVESRVAEGWIKYDFHSYYYECHPLSGLGVVKSIYLFPPGTDLSPILGRSWGHGRNEDFHKFLKEVGEEKYISFRVDEEEY